MKCPMCDGTGKSEIGVGAFTIHGADCDRCAGKGVIEPLTNEEWFSTLSTEEKAKVLRRKTYGNGDENKREEKGWENWFKAEHQDNPPDIPNVPSWDEWLKEEKTKCSRCGGTDVECEFYGKYECPYQPLTITNEEWLDSLPSKDKAIWLTRLYRNSSFNELAEEIQNLEFQNHKTISALIEGWLKEKHK